MSSFKIRGYCPICEKEAEFVGDGGWHRDTLVCSTCEGGSLPRERALALVLSEVVPDWREKIIHECSPADRGISRKLREQASGYLASQYFPDQRLGIEVDGFRNENLQEMTFPNWSHDIFVSLDVFEHIPNPRRAFLEVYRTLKPGGVLISTFPIRNYLVEAMRYRVITDKDGGTHFLEPPEYHGNPIDEKGSIVTVDYGYDIHKLISTWTSFDSRVYRFSDRQHGILGEYTEVLLCRKPV